MKVQKSTCMFQPCNVSLIYLSFWGSTGALPWTLPRGHLDATLFTGRLRVPVASFSHLKMELPLLGQAYLPVCGPRNFHDEKCGPPKKLRPLGVEINQCSLNSELGPSGLRPKRFWTQTCLGPFLAQNTVKVDWVISNLGGLLKVLLSLGGWRGGLE